MDYFSDLLPSAAFRGCEAEAQAFQRWQASINVRWMVRQAPEVQAFRNAFNNPAVVDARDAVIRAR